MKILLQGDSHIRYFKYCHLHNMLPSGNDYIIQEVGGATAQGMVNPNSKTKAMPRFKKVFDETKPDCLVMQLGEVDCGFVIWYRKEKYNISIEEQMNISLTNYMEYLSYCKQKVDKIIVSNVTLPSIPDGSYDKKFPVANARKDVKANLVERTKLTFDYNNRLENLCIKEGFEFLNYNNLLINSDGVLDKRFFNRNKYDHHLDNASIAPILSAALSPLLV